MIQFRTAARIVILLVILHVCRGSCCNVSAQLQSILGTDEVLIALDVDDEQRAALKPLFDKFARGEKMAFLRISGGTPFASLSTSEQESLRPKFSTEMVKIDATAETEIREILSADQMLRLQQLRVQAMGAAGLIVGKLNNELGISSKETENFLVVVTEFQKSFVETYKEELTGKPQDEIERFHKLKLMETILLTLTPEQQEKYKMLTGETVDLPVIAGVR